DTMTKASEQVQAEGQMLFGVHVFSRAKIIPDLALARGEDLYRHSRSVGDRWLAFLAAGGTAMAHLDLGAVEAAEQWLGKAASAAAKELLPLLPGHPPWGVQADAAIAEVALARGNRDDAMAAARSALGGLMAAMHEDLPMDAVLAMAKVFMAAGEDAEKDMVRMQIGLTLAMTAMRTLDE